MRWCTDAGRVGATVHPPGAAAVGSRHTPGLPPPAPAPEEADAQAQGMGDPAQRDGQGGHTGEGAVSHCKLTLTLQAQCDSVKYVRSESSV